MKSIKDCQRRRCMRKKSKYLNKYLHFSEMMEMSNKDVKQEIINYKEKLRKNSDIQKDQQENEVKIKQINLISLSNNKRNEYSEDLKSKKNLQKNENDILQIHKYNNNQVTKTIDRDDKSKNVNFDEKEKGKINYSIRFHLKKIEKKNYIIESLNKLKENENDYYNKYKQILDKRNMQQIEKNQEKEISN